MKRETVELGLIVISSLLVYWSHHRDESSSSSSSIKKLFNDDDDRLKRIQDQQQQRYIDGPLSSLSELIFFVINIGLVILSSYIKEPIFNHVLTKSTRTEKGLDQGLPLALSLLPMVYTSIKSSNLGMVSSSYSIPSHIFSTIVTVQHLLLASYLASVTLLFVILKKKYLHLILISLLIIVIDYTTFGIEAMIFVIGYNILFIILFKAILNYFQTSFTFGEASIISQLISSLSIPSIFYLYDQWDHVNPWPGSGGGGVKELEFMTDNLQVIKVAIVVLIIGAILIGIVTSRLTTFIRNNALIQQSNTMFSLHVLLFYTIALFMIFGVYYPLLYHLIGQNIFLWLQTYLIPESLEMLYQSSVGNRITVIACWIGLLFVTILFFSPPSSNNNNSTSISTSTSTSTSTSKKSTSSSSSSTSTSSTTNNQQQQQQQQQPNIILRKYFHLLAIIMFLPGILMERTFMSLSFGVSISALILIEILKYGRVPPMGKYIAGYMDAFLDARDSGVITLTHIYLLLGCSIPVVIPFYLDISFSTTKPLLSIFSGLLTIGVGDSAASYFGVRYGRTKMFGTSKSLQGTIGGITCTVLACLVLLPFIGIPFTLSTLVHIIITSTLCCLIEASTTQIDNLVLPLVCLSLLNI
ncbi:hypothetical protein DFA_01668 [Cavenderia fasciculata]|uniref:dolichol kinase n=1 Tax=Cavenderia fasciculata TaxID=261658 RepID=F4PU14_CACFS|nr:uncharacterized protein DFA_01668 [Cavenderia fasciculata]EGG21782.1 hypothetical protein DFA_01668 [Cavenderia fasciculata]|eukprot:XP_004359632.1 hypothetical protein DFA_01668 [Cavenderia fasciculata]